MSHEPTINPRRVGTEFARLVRWIPALVPWWDAKRCDCAFWREQMDTKGVEWCEKNKRHLAKMIRKSARRAGVWVPAMETAIRLLIDQAIWRARNPRLRYDAMRRKRQNQGV